LLVVFLAIIVGPIVAGKQINLDVKLPMELLQPNGYSNNDTSASNTGSCIQANCPPYQGGDATGAADSTAQATSTEAARRFRRYMAY
jgi:1,3-beta-glucan synthase